ncbi:Hypothetical protein NTJ_11769 [Nesidiocoris tenuis]|uniref:Uncharacterized protein n=1 Tax=Nesidiocoris tenuis TaxID=355587 RepID=A0ABN7B3H2_9HEMI|nr:Hypothetical protein NTJ_11769 [Nesidiocoris tenuis]
MMDSAHYRTTETPRYSVEKVFDASQSHRRTDPTREEPTDPLPDPSGGSPPRKSLLSCPGPSILIIGPEDGICHGVPRGLPPARRFGGARPSSGWAVRAGGPAPRPATVPSHSLPTRDLIVSKRNGRCERSVCRKRKE